jgi:predicted nucleic acid-binding protein
MALGKRSLMIPAVPHVFSYQRDPKDEPYIDLAIAVGASCLVSRDKDVLDLANPTDADGAHLRHLAPLLRILDPLSFLTELRRKSEAVPGQ